LLWGLSDAAIRAAFDPKLAGASFFERSDIEGLPRPYGSHEFVSGSVLEGQGFPQQITVMS
jgi:hypothetical protein